MAGPTSWRPGRRPWLRSHVVASPAPVAAAAPPPVFRSSTGLAYAGRTNSTLTPPAGLANDDILLCVLMVQGSGTSASPAVTPPAGFTELSSSPLDMTDTAGQHGTTHVYWKRAASESGSYTFTHAAAPNTQAVMLAFSGAITSGDPIDATAGLAHPAGVGGQTATNPGVTTTVANDLLVYAVTDWDGPAKSPPSTYTEIFDTTVIEVATKTISVPSATGGTTHTVNSDPSSPWITYTVALKPVAAAAIAYTLTADVGSCTLAGQDATLTYEQVLSLPVTVAGLSTAVAVCGPFAFGPVETSQIPVATISTAIQNFGQTATISQAGFPFVAASDNSLTNVQAQLGARGTLTDNVVCQIFATSGGLPTGGALGTSTALVGSTIDTALDGVYYDFPFVTPVAMSVGTTYAAVFSRTGAADNVNMPALFGTTSPVGTRGLLTLDISGSPTWNASSTSFPNFRITTNGAPKYFMFGRDATTATTLQVYEWTGFGWASVGTKTGFTTAILLIRGHHIDDTGTVHLAVMDGTLSTSVAVKYTSFDMGPETFLASTETVNAAASITGGLASGWGVDLTVRHDGTVTFIYNSVTVTSMARLSWKKRTGLNTYTSAVRVDDNAAFDSSKPAVSLSFADEIHFFYTFGGTNKFTQRALNSADVLQTSTGTTTLATSWGGTVSFKEPFAAFTSICAGDFNAWSYSGNTPTINVTTNTACGDTRRCFVDVNDSNKIYYLYINSSTGDPSLYSSTDDGITLVPSNAGSSVMTATATQAAANLSIDGKIYTRGNDVVVPYIVNDGGTLKYNESVARTIGGVTHYTMAAGVGTLVLAGQIGDLDTDRKTTGGLGTLTLGGQDATIRAARRTVGGLGVLAASGQTATLWYTRAPMVGGLGTLTLGGQIAGIRAARRTTAGLGTLTMAGQPATFRRTYVMPATTGTVAASGQTVVLRYKRVMPATLGTLTFSGQANVLRHNYVVIATLGTLTLAGQAAKPEWGHKLPAGLGTLTLGGQTATLRYGLSYVLPITTGTLTASGQVVKLAYGRKVPHTLGTLTLGGQTVTLKRSWVMPVTVGTLTLSGQAVVTRYGHVVAAGLGTLTLSGRVVATRAGRAVVANVGTLTLGGQSATLLYGAGKVLPASQGTLTFSGQTVTLRYGRKMPAGLGTLAASGQAVGLRYGRVPLTAGLGTLAAAGQTVRLAYKRVVPHTTGTLTINGQTNRLVWAHKGVSGTGTLTINGQTVNLIYSGSGPKVMPVSTGTVVLGGQAVIARYGRVLKAVNGTITIAGQPAVVKYGRVVTATLGTLTINGQVVRTAVGRKLVVAKGDLLFGGQTALLRNARRLAVTQGVLTFAGQAAVLTPGAGVPTGGVKVWSGSAWVSKPAKVWTGSAWMQKSVKHWNGSAWV